MKSMLRLVTIFALCCLAICVDPDINRNVTQMITARGYPVEQHYAVTPDGFVLSIQRITGPRGSKGDSRASKPAVLLQHGLEDNSISWVLQSPKESLGFILADLGYDVWLSNSRGNTYSNTNVKYKPTSDQFWDFSFDEMVAYDLPTVVNYVVLNSGNQKISYIGHSQGTLVGFAGFGNKDLASKINLFVALAPVAWVHNCKSFLLVALSKMDAVDIFLALGVHDFLPDNEFLKILLPVTCKVNPELCTNLMGLIMGWDTTNINDTRLPVIVAHEPSGTSVKNVVHWSQMIKAEAFQKFDYENAALNIKHYNSTKPPQYDPSLLTIPTALFSGSQDDLADPVDVAHLAGLLKNMVANVIIPTFSHIDFVWGENANTLVYPQVVALVKKYNV